MLGTELDIIITTNFYSTNSTACPLYRELGHVSEKHVAYENTRNVLIFKRKEFHKM